MKTRPVLCPRPLAFAAALTLPLLAALPGSAHAQADLTFSGGQGTPLFLTLTESVTYVVTNPPAVGAPQFDLQGLGNLFSNRPGGDSVSGTISFTINGGAVQTLTSINSGTVGINQAATDVYLYGAEPGLAVGDRVVLTAGTLTTGNNYAAAPPASGSYPTFLIDAYGDRLDVVNGVAPEPSTWALLGLGGLGALGLTLRQRRRARLLSGVAALLCSSAALLPLAARAANPPSQNGAQLLQAQLPADTTLAQADCQQLARAVTFATRTHHADAKAILTAALVRHPQKEARPTGAKLPCACVTRLLRASTAAAPDQASALLELASSLYPDCADSLQAAFTVKDDKNPVDDKDVVDAKDGVGRAPAVAGVSRLDSNAPDAFNPELGTGGFGVGFGPGFPGAPGFVGSAPSGGFALPPASPAPVTSVTNG